MRTDMKILGVVVAVALFPVAAANAADDLQILTWPTPLAAGTMDVEVGLGQSGQAAELYLDGEMACAVTAEDARCTVDLGPGLHVHLLELIRHTADGPVERVERWVNRPGFEAGLTIQLAARPIGSTCGGRVGWVDPLGGDPTELEITAAGQRLAVSADGRAFGYPCADSGRTRVVSVSAVFPEGRRAEAAVETDSSGHIAAPSPWPVALEATSPALDPCGAVEARIPGVRPALGDGIEIAFVLDPSVDYKVLAGFGANQSDATTRRSWQEASDSFADADGLWYVIPSDPLQRVNGFSEGRENWLGGFFARGAEADSDRSFLADAVAAAGLTAGAGPRRRAVVLLLGAGAGNDGSRFNPTEVRSFLAEIGVPLIVLDSGAVAGNGWPGGMRLQSLANLADAFVAVRERLDEQCVEWLPADMNPRTMAASLPAGIVVAGRLGEEAGQGAEVWRRAAVAQDASTPISDEPVASEVVEVTAVTILVIARDAKGRPVTDLDADDLSLTEDGRVMPVLELEAVQSLQPPVEQAAAPAAPTPVASLPTKRIVPVAIYVERNLAGPADIAPALAAVAERAEWLTGLGPVDVVVADQGIETVLKGGVDAAQVREILENLAEMGVRAHGIERIRTEYLRENRIYPDRGSEREGEVEATQRDDSNITRAKAMTSARQAIFQEDALLRKTMERMNDWALSLPATGPRVLVTIGLGFDEDPSDFYIPFLEKQAPNMAAPARAEFLDYNQATRVDGVGRELAAAGWLVVPLATRTLGSPSFGAEYSGGDRFQAFLTDGGGYLTSVDYMLLDPLGSQEHLAAPSGGRVVMGGKGLDKLIAEANGWYRLTYQVARAPDGAYHDVAVASKRPGVEVRGTGVVVSGTSEGRAAMRSRQLLADSQDRGELPVKLTLSTPRSGEGKSMVADLTVTVDFGPVAPLFREHGRRALRFSVVVRSGESESEVAHQLATVDGAVGGFLFEAPLEWTKTAPSEVAIVVEDLGSGAWGGNVLELGN